MTASVHGKKGSRQSASSGKPGEIGKSKRRKVVKGDKRKGSGKKSIAGKADGKSKPAAKQKKTAKGKKKSAPFTQVDNKASIPPRVAKVMSRFRDARLSDVSDKVFVASSPVHGKGLFAAKRIKANTVLGRLQGMPTFDDGIYVLWITEELGLELTNDFKFINHNSEPNAAYSDLDVTVLKDVEPGDELLHDYGW